MYTHFKKGKNCIKIVIFNIYPITKDEYKSRLTSAITRGAQSGYQLITGNYCLSNVDQSVHVSLKICIHFLAPPVFMYTCRPSH
jgi:hypothetical protein